MVADEKRNGFEELNVAIVGAGFVVPIHLRGWSRVAGIRVSAITSRTRSRAEHVAQKFAIPHIYASLEELLDAETPDIVDICTPPEAHLQGVRQAASSGAHVICQKPIAGDLETARKIRDIAREAGIRLMVHENFRFRVWYRNAKAEIDAGVIGKPFYCRSDLRMPGTVTTYACPEEPWSLARQPFFRALDRFLILESVIHQIDVCRFLFGDPHSVFAHARRVSPEVKGEDLATVILDFDGLFAVVERSYASRGHANPPVASECLVVEGEEGALFVDHEGRMRIEIDQPNRRETLMPEYDLTDAYANSYAATIAHFTARLRDGGLFETDIDDNLKTLETTLAAYRSIDTGNAIPLSFER